MVRDARVDRVALRAGHAVQRREAEAAPDVQQDRGEEDDAHRPEQARHLVQLVAVAVDLLRPGEDQGVADHVQDEVADEDHPRHRHHYFRAQRRLSKSYDEAHAEGER
jgi:hypothetical protein